MFTAPQLAAKARADKKKQGAPPTAAAQQQHWKYTRKESRPAPAVCCPMLNMLCLSHCMALTKTEAQWVWMQIQLGFGVNFNFLNSLGQ
jgi:hypothetical protein